MMLFVSQLLPTYVYHLVQQNHNLERLNSDIAYEIHQPYGPLNSIFRPHIRIAHIIDNLVILRPYLALTFSAQNPDVGIPHNRIRPLASQPSGQIHIFGHDGNTFCMQRGEVGILKQCHKIRFRSLLQGQDCG